MRFFYILNKFTIKFKKLHNSLFSYPQIKYDLNNQTMYWEKRNNKLDFKKPPNSFQIERAKISKKYLKDSRGLLFDIGSGDGNQLNALNTLCPLLKIYASDNNDYAYKLLLKSKFKAFKIEEEEELFNLIENIKPDYISLFEVIEHLPTPEKFIKNLMKICKSKIFISVPNTGFLLHRVRFILGRFPLQWIVNPYEHLRFWTLTDMKWWLKFIGLKNNYKITPYEGVPILNRFMPNLFSAGIFIVIDLKNN